MSPLLKPAYGPSLNLQGMDRVGVCCGDWQQDRNKMSTKCVHGENLQSLKGHNEYHNREQRDRIYIQITRKRFAKRRVDDK